MPITSRNMRVSPRQAEVWLETNKENRSLSHEWVKKLARDMRHGQFPNIGEALKFDENGDLIDGQHRLHAVVQSGVTVEFLVVEGVPREDRYKMDKGRKRSAADELTMQYKIPSAQMAVAAFRIVLQWQVEEIKREGFKPTDTEIVDYIVQNRTASAEAVRYGINLRTELGVSPSVAGALYFLTREIAAAEAIEFWTGVHKGAGLVEGDPELTLRNTLIRSYRHANPKAKSVMAMMAQAWNAKREGRKIRRLVLKPLADLTDEHFRLA